MPRLLALKAEWKRNPPLTLMVKAYLGFKDEPDLPDVKPDMPEFAQLPDFED